MAATQPMSGHCLCGAVKFTAAPVKMKMDACHCRMCRRWSGGPFMSVTCDPVSVEDETQLRVYVSSDWAERVSCQACGSALFWRMRDGGFTGVSAQAFDDPGAFLFDEEIFVDEQPANYAFANNTHKLTGAQVIAAFQAKQGN